ncbi:MAG: penicillin-binding transpeptidase domain-containing protein [Proteobacteria bacterium]|nr:penicillin-binding transpeptidase domain-containing protein [Pseudomonadota bacterium]
MATLSKKNRVNFSIPWPSAFLSLILMSCISSKNGPETIAIDNTILDQKVDTKITTDRDAPHIESFPRLLTLDLMNQKQITNTNLTIIPSLQKSLQELLNQSNATLANVTVISVRTGEILASAEINRYPSNDQDSNVPLITSPIFPAASIFKIVSAAAGFDEALPEALGLPMRLPQGCSTEGNPELWLAEPKPLDHKINKTIGGNDISVERAFCNSCNGFFANMAVKQIGLEKMIEYATKLGWTLESGTSFSADFQNEKSQIQPPRCEEKDRISQNIYRGEIGQLAAGFGYAYLSPLHAAWISMVIGNNGRSIPIRIFKGSESWSKNSEAQQIISEETAKHLRHLMRLTVERGTATMAFKKPEFDGVRKIVGGKTGTLSMFDKSGISTWFTGLMPLDEPEIAVSAVVVNGYGEHRHRGVLKGKNLAAESFESS